MNAKLPEDFDPELYLELHPDVRAAGVDPAKHYLDFGMKEKRAYRKSFNALARELARYSSDKPEDINPFQLLDGVWSTYFEGRNGERLTQGSFHGTNDPRMEWLASKMTLENQRILELGPLEGAHTLFLEKMGADVLSVEANIGAFLRCLIVKNQYSLRSRFLLGDFNKLDTGEANFDLVCASGVDARRVAAGSAEHQQRNHGCRPGPDRGRGGILRAQQHGRAGRPRRQAEFHAQPGSTAEQREQGCEKDQSAQHAFIVAPSGPWRKRRSPLSAWRLRTRELAHARPGFGYPRITDRLPDPRNRGRTAPWPSCTFRAPAGTSSGS